MKTNWQNHCLTCGNRLANTPIGVYIDYPYCDYMCERPDKIYDNNELKRFCNYYQKKHERRMNKRIKLREKYKLSR